MLILTNHCVQGKEFGSTLGKAETDPFADTTNRDRHTAEDPGARLLTHGRGGPS